MVALKDQIMHELDRLTPEQQQRLLDFSRELRGISVLPPGTPGEILLAKMEQFQFEPGAVDEMMQIIEAEYENVNQVDDDWQ
jgi:hypothetical protein